MVKILFKGWTYGLEKISLTKLFQQKANLSLKEAKGKTDALLDGEIFIIETEDISQAEELTKEATAIGAVCEMIER